MKSTKSISVVDDTQCPTKYGLTILPNKFESNSELWKTQRRGLRGNSMPAKRFRHSKRLSLTTIVIVTIAIVLLCPSCNAHRHHQHHHHHHHHLHEANHYFSGGSRPRLRNISTGLQLSSSSSSPFFDYAEDNLVEDDDIAERESFLSRAISPSANTKSASQATESSLVNDEQTAFLSTLTDNFIELWNFTQVNLANAHLFYIRTKFSCSKPRAKLVNVLDYHPSISKQYVPRCTVLHKCDDESGCCEDVTQRCAPSKTEVVHLYFHVIWSDRKNNITGGSASGIDKLTFLNHTKCECKSINYMPRSGSARYPIPGVSAAAVRPSTTTSLTTNTYSRPLPVAATSRHKCRHIINCTEPFERRYRLQDNRCVCDCLHHAGQYQHHAKSEQEKRCHAIQSGLAALDHNGARCVRTEKCAAPVCVAGLRFNATESRCVKEISPIHRLHRHHLHRSHRQQQQQQQQQQHPHSRHRVARHKSDSN